MFRRPYIIANPISGGGRAEASARQLETACRAQGQDPTLRLTEKSGDAENFARDLPSDADAIIVVGGDGTLNSAINGLDKIQLPFTQLPMGTANVLACEYKLPKTAEACAKMLLAGNLRTIPIGQSNLQRFVLFAGVGMDAAIVHRLEQVRSGTLGKHKWAGPILHTIWNWPTPKLRVVLNDGSTHENLSQVLVTAVANYGGVMRMPQKPGPGLSVLCFHQRSRFSYARAALRALLGRLRVGVDVDIIEAETLRIEGEAPAHVQLDGDYAGLTPVSIQIETEAAQLIVP